MSTYTQRHTLSIDKPFGLEGGDRLPSLSIHYTVTGELNKEKSNVIWVFHALTANSDPSEWWGGLFGDGKIFDPCKYYIVCANMLGSCYGSTHPIDYNFPLITIRDIVNAHKLLKDHLCIQKIFLGIGGSMGGQQLLQWAVDTPMLFEKIVPLATNARHSPWGIAFNEAQRMALDNVDEDKGLEAARAIAMLSYRHYMTFEKTQSVEDDGGNGFRAASYMNYQGLKLRKRFNAISYHYLSKAMDSHNLGRGFESIPHALKRIKSDSLVITMSTDILFPNADQQYLVKYIKNAQHRVINTDFGHDGFLIETKAIAQFLTKFISK